MDQSMPTPQAAPVPAMGNGNKGLVWIVLAICVVLILAVAAYFYFMRPTDQSTDQGQDSSYYLNLQSELDTSSNALGNEESDFVEVDSDLSTL